MRHRAILAVLTFFNLQFQAWAQFLPSNNNMCGVIVDSAYREECVICFEAAGPLSLNPEAVRACVATYLPPVMASCAVPQAKSKLDRIGQIHPQVHPNNTNANLLPNCIKRRLRELNRYLEKENLFTKQAGDIVKTVVLTKLLRMGGANMLGVYSQKKILDLFTVRNLVNQYASSCIDDYENSRSLLRENMKYINSDSAEDADEEDSEEGDVRDDQELDLEELQEIFRSTPEHEWEDEDELMRSSRANKGNGLPYGGTNDLASEMILGECIVDKLIESNTAIYLIQTINSEEFYYPIPFWWVEKLLYYYQDYRLALEG